MQLTITINVDDKHFAECPGTEVARVLRHFADKIDGDDLNRGTGTLYYVKGNRIGSDGASA